MFKCTYWESNYFSQTLEKMLKELSDTIKASKYKFEYIDLGGGMNKYTKMKTLSYIYT